MSSQKPINLFYEEPNPDRWIKYDRYPRAIIRRLLRGKPKPGGVMMVALELMKGLDLLKIPYRFNDYKYAKQNPDELIGVIGKPHLIFEKRFKNPILFGAGVFSHPVECPDFFEKYPNVKKMLVPGEWMQKMCEPFYGRKVQAWPVGIDTEKWSPEIKQPILTNDFLIYNKIRWDQDRVENAILNPIVVEMERRGLSYKIIKYGSYKHTDLLDLLSISKAAIFLCEHETQGIAYQQILSTGTPILAWDEGEVWKDPTFYPDLVQFGPVSSVPYWGDECGLRFKNSREFPILLNNFLEKLDDFNPRAFIIENLSLRKSAENYLEIFNSLHEDITNR